MDPAGAGPVTVALAVPIGACRVRNRLGWTCFHCGDHFLDEEEARGHFGATEGARAGCHLQRVGAEAAGLLVGLRQVEEEGGTLRVELMTVNWGEDECDQAAPEDTYQMMAGRGWICFHCGERFMEAAARVHFGQTPDAQPGCVLQRVGGDAVAMLAALRVVEEERDVLKVRLLAAKLGADQEESVARFKALRRAGL